MKASDLIGCKLKHNTDSTILGTLTDILFDETLDNIAFFLADITTPKATAPIMFSPVVLAWDDDGAKISAAPADIIARVDASIHRVETTVDPADYPSTLIGPFGNTISPAMIVALFNARTNADKSAPREEAGGVWFSELKGAGLRVHVADLGHIVDCRLDQHIIRCEAVILRTQADVEHDLGPDNIRVQRSPDRTLLLTAEQADLKI